MTEAVSRVPKGICAVCGNKKVCEDAKRNLDMTMCSIFELDTHYDLSVEAVQGEWVDEDGNKVPLDKDSYPLGSCWCNQCYEWLGGSDEYAMLTRAFAPHTGSTYEYEDEDESGEESEVEE